MQLIDYSNKTSLAYRLRKKRIKYLVEHIERLLQQTKSSSISIADIGGSQTYWKVFPFHQFPKISFQIHLINIEYPEYDKDEPIASNVIFFRLTGDACDLSDIPSNQYDLCHSNSVIEHVGGYDRIEMIAKEIQRIAKHYYLQTPNYWFPVEPHFLIPGYTYLPRPIRCWLLAYRFKITSIKAIKKDSSIFLLTKNELRNIFQNPEIRTERFLGMSKSFIVISKFRNV